MVRELWNDPVWSKVIAGLITAAVLAVLAVGAEIMRRVSPGTLTRLVSRWHNQVAMWAGLITVPLAIAWYITSVQNIAKSWHAGPNSVWPDIFAFFALTSFVTTLLANAVAHSRLGRIAPTVGLNFRNSAMDPYATGRTYPRKLNVYLSNDGDDIRLGEAKWIKDQVELQADKPPRIMYLLRNHPGGRGSLSQPISLYPVACG